MKAKATTQIVVPDGTSITMSCQKCMQQIADTKNKFMVGLTMRTKEITFKYFLALTPPLKCCGEEKFTIWTFETEPEAEAELKKLETHLRKCHTVEGLRLVPIPFPGRTVLN